MKILITQRELERYGGSELFTADISRGLANRGHKVAIYCPRPGKIARLISPSGIEVRDNLNDLSFVPDIIHGHHHLPCLAAIARFPSVPAIYCWHGSRPWVENVPLHPNIQRYVVTSSAMAPRLLPERGITLDRIDIIPNFVDIKRFSFVRKVIDRPRSAVLYGHGGFSSRELDILEQACTDNGVSLDKVGYPYNNPRPRPEYFLPDYDIAFAIGRCALEALASGCAVIPIVPQLAGKRITSATLTEWEASNYSPRYYTSAMRFDSDWLGNELAEWAAHDVVKVTSLVRDRYTLEAAMMAFEASYAAAINAPPSESGKEAPFAHYIEWLAQEVDDFWSKSNQNEALIKNLHEKSAALTEDIAASGRMVRILMEMVLATKGVDMRHARSSEDSDVYQRLSESGLFDPEWYLKENPDVAQAGIDPLRHYLSSGALENRNPSPTFDQSAYKQAHPYLNFRALGLNPLEHFLNQLEAATPVRKGLVSATDVFQPESEKKRGT